MTPERWQQVEDLYHKALEYAEDKRSSFLAGACAGDAELLRTVERLLKAHARAGLFLATPALEALARTAATEQAGFLVGQQMSHYEILSLLGAGGMGEVYLARDPRLDRRAALKILPASVAADPDRMQRFIREAQAASALNHPNVATIYDIGQADGISFIAMEYIEGQTLAAEIGGHPLDPADVVEIGIQVADALGEAHAKGITHRDIKPANIILTPRRLAKVLDFGLAKIARNDVPASAETEPGLVLGTMQYMSPEQVLGREVDHRTDIFSLGVVLYEMATGRSPFAGPTATETMDRVLHAQTDPIARFNEKVQPELERIVLKCLEKDRERRYQSARELLVDLGNLKRDSSLGPVRIERVMPQPWTRSRRRILAALSGAAVALGAAGVFLLAPRGQTTAIESVAVLPFVNVTADPETEYLADGITENIISNLSQLSQLKVMSRTSVFRYKGRQVDPQAVGQELSVEAVLAGRVVPHGDQITISLELIDVNDNRQLWGEQYTQNLADLLRLQSEISREVSDKLRIRLSGAEQEQLAKAPTENTEAYQLYLKGRFYRDKMTEDGLKKAIDYFQQAVDKDPNYALAYVGLADSYIGLGADFMSPREAMPKAKAYAMKALDLDEKLAEAHSSLGVIHLVYDWNWAAAAEELRDTLSLSPNAVESFSCSLHYADPIGRNDEAIAAIKRALVSDPFSLMINLELGCASYYGHQYDQAIKQLTETLAMYPDNAAVSFLLGRAYAQKKMYREAISALSSAKPASGDWPPIVAELGYAYAASGNRAEAQKMLQELRQQAARRFVDPYFVAMVYIGLGDKDQAFAELDNAYRQRSGWLPWLNLDPKWDSLHSDSRFIDLARRVGLTL